MMLYLPDTNVWIRELNNASSVVQKRFRATHRDEIALCDVVKAELYFGAFKSSCVQENLAGLAKLFGTFEKVFHSAVKQPVFTESYTPRGGN